MEQLLFRGKIIPYEREQSMNILFFLTPKSEVHYLETGFSIRQAAEKLAHYNYTALPLLDNLGRYIGTVSDGDLFWYFKDHPEMTYRDSEKEPVVLVPRKHPNKAIRYDAKMEDLLTLAMLQNFVPVLDDENVFMGIVTRQAIIRYFVEKNPNQ